MIIRIEFNTDNAAFDIDPMAEAERIIAQSVEKLRTMPVYNSETLYDTNGNRVGFISILNN